MVAVSLKKKKKVKKTTYLSTHETTYTTLNIYHITKFNTHISQSPNYIAHYDHTVHHTSLVVYDI
ncbi:hypothetical protein SGP16001_43890 [Shigella flexneri]|nr:hypothetical protein SGP16001_43890 [Shigella flexneri]